MEAFPGHGDGIRRRITITQLSDPEEVEADRLRKDRYMKKHEEQIRKERDILKNHRLLQKSMKTTLSEPHKRNALTPSGEESESDEDIKGSDGSSEEENAVEQKKVGRIAPGILGIPIEELDPYISGKTFCVLSRKFGQHYLYRFSAAPSLQCFYPTNPVRRQCLFAYTHELFDWCVMFVIILNCIVLALDNNELEHKRTSNGTACTNPDVENCYLDVKESTTLDELHPHLSKTLEWIFLFLFTLEAWIKIMSKGFYFNNYSYLRNSWNKLDFTLVLAGYATEIVELTSYKHQIDLDVLRALRVLRAVKLLSLFPGLRLMLNSITNAITQLLEVAALTIFCLSILALLGLNLFTGKMHQICVNPSVLYTYSNGTTATITCNLPALTTECQSLIFNKSGFVNRTFPKTEPIPCGNDTNTRHCPVGTVCRGGVGDNPDDGWTSFDDFFKAMLTTFQIFTLDYWERVYELTMSVAGPMCVPFFVLVVFFGAYYLMNLILAVITTSYEEEVSGDKAEAREPLSPHDQLARNRESEKFTIEDPLHYFLIFRYNYSTKKTVEATRLNWKLLEEGATERSVGDTKERSVSQIGRMSTFGDVVDAAIGNVTVARKLTSTELDRVQERKILQQETVDKVEWRAKLNEIAERVEDGEILGEDAVVDGDEFEEDDPEELAFNKDLDYLLPPLDRMPDSMFIDPDWADEILSSTGKPYAAFERKTRSVRQAVSLIERIRGELEMVVDHWIFEAFITTAIVLNTFLLAADHHDAPVWFEELSTLGSEIFTAIFTFECVIKIFALRTEYFRQPWNLLDLLIVTTSLLDETLQATTSLHAFPATKAIRVLRLLRIFKLAQSWVTMKILLNIIFSTFGSLASLTTVLLLLIYVFAVVGMQFIGRRYTPRNFGVDTEEDEGFPRWNFKDIWHSFMMIFRVLCGEWIEPLWECLQAHKAQNHPFIKDSSNEQWKCFFIFIPALVVGNFVVLNLFLALLLDSFSSEEMTAQRQKEEETSGKQYDVKKVVDILANQKVVRQTVKDNEDVLALLAEALNARREDNEFTIKIDEKNEPAPRVFFKRAAQKIIMTQRVERAEQAIALMEQNQWLKEAGSWVMSTRPEHRPPDGANRFEKNPLIDAYAKKRQHTLGAGYELHSTSSTTSAISVDENWEVKVSAFAEERLLLSNPNCFPDWCTSEDKFKCCMIWRRLRKLALKLVSWSVFEWTIIMLILASSITLCFEDVNLQDGSDLKKTLDMVNNVFTAIFVIEMLLKWMAYGFYQYFTTAWTVLDFVIIIISVITIPEIEVTLFEAGSGKVHGLAAFKALRTLRALRPLRAISRWEGMKIVVNALLNSIPSIRNVLVVCLLFWLVFAIMAVNLFKGKFQRCVYLDDMKLVPYDIVQNKSTCCGAQFSGPNATNRMTWINNFPNFDNVFMAYVSLFQIATFEGWIELMRSASDLPTKLDEQPRRDQSYMYYFFFVVFIIFGSFFTLNLFIGVIIDNFNTLKKKYEGNFVDALLTDSQRRYYMAVKKLGQQKPTRATTRPKNVLCALCFDIATSRSFEPTIFCLILLNTFAMGFEHYNLTKMGRSILATVNGWFGVLFTLEALVKIAAFRVQYFKVPWNLLDFSLVTLFFVDLVTEKLPFPAALFRIIRVFRIGRLFRIIKVAKGIKKLLFALVLSIPALFNIGALLGLITFIYSIIGMALFKDAVYEDYRTPPYNGAPIDGFFSFQTFGKSSLMLFRLFTAAGWNEVLDALVQTQGCGGYRKLKCGGVMPGGGKEPDCIPIYIPVIFMFSYLIITYLIIINMYIAVILENYEEANRDEETGIFEDDIEAFYTTWSKFDPHATQFIAFEDLSIFLASLDPPFGIPYPNLFVIVALDFPIARGNKIHCLDVLHILIKRLLGKTEGGDEFRKVQKMLDLKFRKEFPARKMFEIVGSTKIWKLQQTAAGIIQKRWKEYRQKKKEEEILTDITRKMFAKHKSVAVGRVGKPNE